MALEEDLVCRTAEYFKCHNVTRGPEVCIYVLRSIYFVLPKNLINRRDHSLHVFVLIQLFVIPLHAARRAMAAACRCPQDKPRGSRATFFL